MGLIYPKRDKGFIGGRLALRCHKHPICGFLQHVTLVGEYKMVGELPNKTKAVRRVFTTDAVVGLCCLHCWLCAFTVG